jgi:hypothetical protein
MKTSVSLWAAIESRTAAGLTQEVVLFVPNTSVAMGAAQSNSTLQQQLSLLLNKVLACSPGEGLYASLAAIEMPLDTRLLTRYIREYLHIEKLFPVAKVKGGAGVYGGAGARS